MASAELYAWLIEATLATSAAALVVFALRKPLRAAFGAGACHAAWSAVPVALLATLLPAAEADAPGAAIRVPIRMLVVDAPRSAAPDIVALACIAWFCGCLAFAVLLAWQQRRFVRGLGRIADRGDGLWLADSVAGLPAAVGVWKPRIVMPADAMDRYDVAERALMLAHEREHIARGDLLANACVAALRCLFWFNPLLHVAARRFRDDQELACDARVIARHPHSRRAYGEAMLKTQMAAVVLPLGCHWGQSHPLKERIEMLKRPLPSSLRSAGGRALVIAILMAAGYAAWAAQPVQPAVAPAGKGVAALATPPPVYPVDVAKQGVTGRVVMVVDVAADGSVSAVKIERSAGNAQLDKAALDAVAQWKFKPMVENGKPMPSQVRVPIDFEMDGNHDEPVKEARAALARQSAARLPNTPNWSSYDRMVRSFSASWDPQATPEEGC